MGNLSRRYVEAAETPHAEAKRRVRRPDLSPPVAPPLEKGRGEDESGVRRGRPRLERKGLTREALKPWEAAGMSRATFYRRLREARDGRAKDE